MTNIGIAISKVETKRRRHFLLQNMDELDLSQAPHLIAAQAMIELKDIRPIKWLLKKLKKNLQAELGVEAATELMVKLHKDAHLHHAQATGLHELEKSI